jgi:hypothetical protein
LPAHLVLASASMEGLHCIETTPGDPRARVHPSAIHAQVQPSRADAQPRTAHAEVETNAGRDAEAATKS